MRPLRRAIRAGSGAGRTTAALVAALLALGACTAAPGTDPTEESQADEAAVAEPDPADDTPDDEPVAAVVEEPPLPPEPPPPPESRAGLVAHLQPRVAGAAARAAAGGLAVLVVDEHGREVVAHEPDMPLMPASTMKSVTAAAVLYTLGPEAQLITLVESTAPIEEDGVLAGDLAILGVGDPALATDLYGRWIYPARPRTSFDSLADQLVALGLTRVTGDVIGVTDGFTGDGRAEGWRDRYFSDFDARYIGGLTVDAGLITLLNYPELDAALAALEAEANSENIEGAEGEPASLIGADLDDLAPDELAELLELESPGDPEVKARLASDPAAHAAAELVRLLEDRGVEVLGEARSGHAPEPIVGRLASVESPPLTDLLRFALKRSDNHMTDQLFQVLGRVRTGEGSWERGSRAVGQVLDHLGIDLGGTHFADGSGLSRDDRLTARVLVDVDRVMTDLYGEVWTSSMAVMGVDGTLERRLRGTPAQGRFFGKTGTLNDVAALAGTVPGADGRRYHVAVVANDPGEGRWAARLLMDEIVLALVADLDGCALRVADSDDTVLGLPPSVVAC